MRLRRGWDSMRREFRRSASRVCPADTLVAWRVALGSRLRELCREVLACGACFVTARPSASREAPSLCGPVSVGEAGPARHSAIIQQTTPRSGDTRRCGHRAVFRLNGHPCVRPTHDGRTNASLVAPGGRRRGVRGAGRSFPAPRRPASLCRSAAECSANLPAGRLDAPLGLPVGRRPSPRPSPTGRGAPPGALPSRPATPDAASATVAPAGIRARTARLVARTNPGPARRCRSAAPANAPGTYPRQPTAKASPTFILVGESRGPVFVGAR